MAETPPIRFTREAAAAMKRHGEHMIREAVERAFYAPTRVDPSYEDIEIAPVSQRRQTRWDETGVSIVVDTRTGRIVYVTRPEVSE